MHVLGVELVGVDKEDEEEFGLLTVVVAKEMKVVMMTGEQLVSMA